LGKIVSWGFSLVRGTNSTYIIFAHVQVIWTVTLHCAFYFIFHFRKAMSFSSTSKEVVSDDEESTQQPEDASIASTTSATRCNLRYNLWSVSSPYRTIGVGNNDAANQPLPAAATCQGIHNNGGLGTAHLCTATAATCQQTNTTTAAAGWATANSTIGSSLVSVYMLVCGHVYHLHCIDRAWSYVCPTLPKFWSVCRRVCHPPLEVWPPPSLGVAVINVDKGSPAPPPWPHVATRVTGVDTNVIPVPVVPPQWPLQPPVTTTVTGADSNTNVIPGPVVPPQWPLQPSVATTSNWCR
jgi:hypothetical protein